MRVFTFSRGVTARVAQTVEVAEATWVLYFFKSLLRVDSSMIQALLVGMMAGVGLEVGEKGGACSVRLPTVMP
jgi:hypothetical protein